MSRPPKKTLGKAAAAMAAVKVMGAERTVFPETELSELELLGCLGWYNNVKSPKDAKEYVIDWMVTTCDCRLPALKKTSDLWIRPTAGWLARMLTHGANISDQTIDTFHRLINESIRATPFEEPEDSDTEETVKPVRPARGPRTEDVLADVEDALDDWRTQPFSFYGYLVARKTDTALVGPVIAFYVPLADELNLALTGKDKEVRDAYSYLNKTELRRYASFVNNIVADGQRYVQEGKPVTVRKPRKKKEIPIERRLANLLYLKEYRPNQLKSVEPEKLLGASEVWLFDTVSKKLHVVVASSPKGLDLVRTTLVGFDPAASGSKRIGRGTSRTLDAILKGTKQSTKRVFDELSNDRLETLGRSNRNTIILRVFP